MTFDCIVVGSGISGLTASAILNRKGLSVALIEARPHMGGSLRQFRRDGQAYDVGFHYTGCLGHGEILDLLWRYSGILEDLVPIRLAGRTCDRYEFADGSEPVRGDFSYTLLRDELCSRFPAEVEAIDEYFERVRRICSTVPFYDIRLPLTPFLRGYKVPAASFSAFLDSRIRSPKLRAVLQAPGFLYGVPTVEASFEVHSLVSHGYYAGAWTVAGGGQAIVDAFLARLTRGGVHLLPSRKVERILSDSDGVSGVELEDGEQLACKKLVYTGHPSGLVERVDRSWFRPAYLKRLSGLRNSLSMYAVFGRADRAINTLDGVLNYYLLPLGSDVVTTETDAVQPLMLTSTRTRRAESKEPGSVEGSVLSAGENGIIVLRPGSWSEVEKFVGSGSGARKSGYSAFKERVIQDMLETVQQRWGDVTGTIEVLAAGTPLTFRDELGAPQGCTYGAMHSLDQFTPETRTRLPGLFLAGQSILMTGVVGASISALVAAGEILGLEELWQEVRSCL